MPLLPTTATCPFDTQRFPTAATCPMKCKAFWTCQCSAYSHNKQQIVIILVSVFDLKSFFWALFFTIKEEELACRCENRWFKRVFLIDIGTSKSKVAGSRLRPTIFFVAKSATININMTNVVILSLDRCKLSAKIMTVCV